MSAPSVVGRLMLAALVREPLRLAATPRTTPPRRVILVSHGENPSADYYLRPRLDGTVAALPHHVVSPWSDPRAVLADDPAGTFVLFCRYFGRRWVEALETGGDRLAGAGLFLDDDIEAVVRDGSTPMGYRLRLGWRNLRLRGRLGAHLDRLWVSTPELARRFPAARAEVLPPLASAADAPRPRPAGGAVRIAFHATGVHDAEHAWLAPIVARLTAARPQVAFETIADGARARRWREVAGVTVVAPMPWPAYRAHTGTAGYDLMLAPLLDTEVNRARSATKRIEAYRAGAALVTTAPWVYGPSAEETALGMIAPHDAEGFLAALIGLVDAPERLERLRAANAERVAAMGREAAPLFAGPTG